MAEKKENSNATDTFEIGLVMGGAVSAGAYTAGVLDFLFEALDRWEAARQTEENLPPKEKKNPPHKIKINVVAGGSAGGIMTAISAVELRGKPHALLPPGDPWPESTSRFYRAWVKEVTLLKLLQNNDLDHDQRVKSILNTNAVLDTAHHIMSVDNMGEAYHRPYIADQLKIILPLANLRGVPYDIEFQGNRVFNYGMRMHKDHITFKLDQHGNLHGDSPEMPTDEAWKKLAICGVAAGIFPVGFAPQMIGRRATDYNHRKWLIPNKERTENGEHLYEFKEESIEPDWPGFIKGDKNYNYRFLSVDGGVFNNEPFDLARRELMADDFLTEQNPKLSSRAIFMIDPFPEVVLCEQDYEAKGYLMETIGQLVRSLINQGRFKIEDVYLAKKNDICGRYMMVPRRNGEFSHKPLACGYLGGFSGFFKEEFRVHDYFLGRRNCQQFLRRHFALPYKKNKPKDNNPIFKHWTDEMVETHGFTNNEGQFMLPVIPLMQSMRTPIEKYPYPSYTTTELAQYREPIKKRINTLLKSFFKNDLFRSRLLFQLLGRPVSYMLSKWVSGQVLKMAEKNFRRGLIRDTTDQDTTD